MINLRELSARTQKLREAGFFEEAYELEVLTWERRIVSRVDIIILVAMIAGALAAWALNLVNC